MTANTAENIEALLPNTYFDARFDIEAVKLLPGQYFVSKSHKLLVTVAGSTTVVCLRDRYRHIGGMTNFMLADFGREYANPASPAARSGTQVMDLLLARLATAGAYDPHAIEAKIFGGGKFGGPDFGNGERNTEFLIRYLTERKIRIVAQSMRGDFARKVYFFPHTGRLLVRKIRKANNNTILDRERDYRRWLNEKFPAGRA